jgi:short-subunit dehydrogenase
MMGIEQKVAVITGASQGIGAALGKAYRGGRNGSLNGAVTR